MINLKNKLSMMVDVETMGNESTPLIVQISAVIFDIHTGQTFEQFDMLIDPKTAIKHGLTINGSTMEFWTKQPVEAFEKVIMKAMKEGKDLEVVLDAFSAFVEQVKKTHKVKSLKWYGNGDDWSWVASNYYATKRVMPVPFWDALDVRTAVEWGLELFGESFNPKKTTVFDGIRHDAISDCLHQIKYLVEIFQKIKQGLISTNGQKGA